MKDYSKTLRLGTRGSPLALWQARWVRDALCRVEPSLDVELVVVHTRAENFPEKELAAIGVGVFTRELDEALLWRDIDLAVHSLKDVPSILQPDLTIAAVPERESPLDAFISRDRTPLEALPQGAKIGTGSPRRKAQLLYFRRDLEIVPLRGNVGTRLSKVEEQGLAGTILAHAGLKRMGEEARITQLLEADLLLPAVSQGALAVLTREENHEAQALLAALDHRQSRLRVSAERAFLGRLRGGCQVPVGALATFSGRGAKAESPSEEEMLLQAVVVAPDGSARVRGERTGPSVEAESLGTHLAEELLERGGKAILEGMEKG